MGKEQMIFYKEVDVSFSSKCSEVKLSGTLTLPINEDKHAVIILISGSGPLDRDSTFFNHKPFRVIADYFARKGIAVMSFDKRGVGQSTGDFYTATTEDFAQDVLDAIEYLKGLKEIDSRKIGLIGHSEGGFIASMVASKTEDAAFTIMIASPAMPIKDNVSLLFALLANEDKANAQNFDEDKAVFKRFFGIVTKSSLTPKEKRESLEIAEKMLPRMSDKSKAVLGFAELTPEAFITIFSAVPCIQGFLNSDPESFLARIKCPMLAVYGEKDVQVPSKENIEAVNAMLRDRDNLDYTVKEIPGVNHLFQKCRTGYPSEYQAIKQTMVSEALEPINTWVSDRIM